MTGRIRLLPLLVLRAFLICLVISSVGAAKQKKPYTTPLIANDIMYLASTDRVYASVSSESSSHPDTIAIIIPKKGKVEDTIQVGKQPRKLAASSDERYLYVEVAGPRVQCIDLTINKIISDYSVVVDIDRWTPNSCQNMYVADMKVMPGHPESIAVALYCQEYTGVTGIGIFDNGVRRSIVSSSGQGAGSFCFGASPDVIWGYDSVSDGFALTRFKVDSQGVTADGASTRGLVFGFQQNLEFYNDLIYTPKGRVIDPEKRTFDNRFYSFEVLFASAFAMDKEAGQVYFTTRNGFDLIISSFDMKTYCRTGYYQGQTFGIGDATSRMVRCGKGGLAAIGNDGIVFFPLSMLEPTAPYEKPAPVPINRKVRHIPLLANGLISDRVNGVLYASVPSAAGLVGNSVVAIDPFKGKVGDPVWVGSEPWQMAIGDGGRFLNVALYGAAAVRRLKLPDLIPDFRFALSSDADDKNERIPLTAYEMLPVTGSPQSVIVARRNPDLSPGSQGVAVYDDGVRRPLSAPPDGSLPVNTIQLSASGDRIFGLDNETTGFSFTTLSLNSMGVQVLSVAGRLGGGFNAEMKCQNDICYTASGLVIDANAQERLGQIIFEDKPTDFLYDVKVLPDIPHGHIFFLMLKQSGVYILAYDPGTYRQVASLKIAGATGRIGDFLMWNNDDQFAFIADDQIFLVPLSLLF